MRKDHLKGIEIVHEDRDILVIDKPAGLLTMASETEMERTAYHILTDYVRKGYSKSRQRIFIVHRLDRDTSGIVIFAKNSNAKHRLQDQWDETEKKYLAVVHGHMEKESGNITSYLAENIAHKVYSTKNRSIGKLSTTHYWVIKETPKYSLLEVDLLTGRKNQIRVHLAETGHSIVGDIKYGDKIHKECDRSQKRMALHAYSISFVHPWTGKRMLLKTRIPDYFFSLAGNFA